MYLVPEDVVPPFPAFESFDDPSTPDVDEYLDHLPEYAFPSPFFEKPSNVGSSMESDSTGMSALLLNGWPVTALTDMKSFS